MENVVDLKDGVLKGSEKVEEEVGAAVKYTEVRRAHVCALYNELYSLLFLDK